jgi:hypothetical protein
MRDAVPIGGHDYYGPDIEARDSTTVQVRDALDDDAFRRAVHKGSRADLAAAVELSTLGAPD